MQITRKEINDYNARLDAIADMAADMAANAYDAWRKENPTASVAEIRNAVIEITTAADAAFGGAVCTVAGQLCDEIAATKGKTVTMVMAETDNSLVEQWARRIVAPLVPDREDI